jgi:hypothetical protein
MGCQELLDVRVVGKLLEYQAHGNACSPNYGFSAKDPGIRGDAIFVGSSLSFFHSKSIIPHWRYRN